MKHSWTKHKLGDFKLFPLHLRLQVRMQKHSRCVVRNTSLLLLQFLFTCDTSNREVSFLIFFSWVRIVIGQVGKVHLLRFSPFFLFIFSTYHRGLASLESVFGFVFLSYFERIKARCSYYLSICCRF